VLNKRMRLLFLFILFMALTIVLAIFGLVIAAVFRQYPAAILPCLLQIPIAVLIGVWLHRKGVNILIPSIIALGIMYLTVIFGDVGILGQLNDWFASWSIITWVVVLLLYSYVASVLPVWTLLQPRDYINSLQLLTALGLVLVGLFCAALFGGAPAEEGASRLPLEFVAPAIREDAREAGAPMLIPFLFITIACGAISGFHCLVSSGTSSKQVKCETDAQFVGYGSMLTEGFLATVVILACAAGIGLGVTHVSGDGEEIILTGEDAYLARYASWEGMGLDAKVGAFVVGSANFLKAMGIPAGISVALMGVLVASFAGTTLDTACRLQRYVIQELASTFAPVDGKSQAWNPLVWLTNKHGATIVAITLAAAIAALPKPSAEWSPEQMFWENFWATAGTGGLILWPLFGATNQLLAGLAFLVISFYLWRRKVPVWFVAVPMVFMLIMPAWAMLVELPRWISPAPLADGTVPSTNWTVVGIAIATLVLELWMIIEAALLWPRAKGVLEEALPPLPKRPELQPAMAGVGADGGSC